MWQLDKTNVSIMDITNLTEQTMDVFVNLDRVIVANILMDMFEADCIITADSEEDMMGMFPNASVIHEKGVVN
jgi:hypothetical protein